jgi:DNA (cytosine-5)-methyltransferase 1
MSTDVPYTIIDLFCGTGALSYGLESYGRHFRTVGGIDLDETATLTAAQNHPDAHVICGPIELVTPAKMLSGIRARAIDVVVGGPPCQGFSSLRPSRGQSLSDPRNSLYKHFLKYVRELQPKIFLMENVVGLLTIDNGRLLTKIISSFKRNGYRTDWRVLNAAAYGVPQKRERFFLVGVHADAPYRGAPLFPQPTHRFSGKVIGTTVKEKYVRHSVSGLPTVTVRDAISDLPSLRAGEAKNAYGKAPQTEYQASRRKHAPNRLTLHEAASHNAKMLTVIRHSGPSMRSLPKGLVSSGYSSCYSRLSYDEPSTTITVKFTSPASSKCIHPADDRAITPREAARLQGFDDAFQFCGSKTEIASQIGNAVPPLFGHAFAPALLEMLDA